MPSVAVSSSPRSADQSCFRGATESSSGATAAVPVRHAPSTGCFEFGIWSGARDLTPGPHGPEPSSCRVLQYPRGSSSVRSYLIAVCFVSFRVLLDPPGSGILCPGCAPAVPRRWSTDRSKADPFPWQRTKTRWCRPQRRYGQHGRESVQRGDVGLCPASEEVVFASQSVAVNHTLSSRKGDTALPYRPHSFTRSWRPEPYPAPFKPPAARRPWQARSTHPRTTGHRRGSRISPL